jgi:hypothetical protein
MKFSVGMATYDDFDGVYFTCMALKLYHSFHVNDIIVVDNNPRGAYSKATAAFCMSAGITYVELPTPQGTAAPRNKVFEHASNEHVVCVDSHIMLRHAAFVYLEGFYANHGMECPDLVQGPMYYDWLTQYETHFNDEWRGEMWGTWGRNEAAFNEGKPFEIPAMGLGVFACRKDSWLRFNDAFRGFGGEEFYIHTKYRQAGRKCWCVPGFGWCHRFGRPRDAARGEAAPYRLDKWD